MSNKIDGVKPFGELSKKQKYKLFQDWLDGADIESWSADQECWYKLTVIWWLPVSHYRIKPKSETLAPTPDSIDWSHVAPNFRFMARNKDGWVYLFSKKPEISEGAWWSNDNGTSASAEAFLSYKRGTVDWKDSLIERPE